MSHRAPTLVLLAGGASTRLGTCKALVRIGPLTPLEHLLAAGSCPSAGPPLVIGGKHFEAIAAAAPPGARVLRNPHWEAGRTGSIAIAVSAVPGRDLCLAPVDVPLVPSAVFEALRSAWSAAGAPPAGWLAPHVGPGGEAGAGAEPRRGHPVILGRALLERVAAAEPDQPLRDFRSLATPVWSIPVAGNEVLDDLDGPEDLERLRSRFGPVNPDSPPRSTP